MKKYLLLSLAGLLVATLATGQAQYRAGDIACLLQAASPFST